MLNKCYDSIGEREKDASQKPKIVLRLHSQGKKISEIVEETGMHA